jgi:hypothetical protein
VVEGGNADQLVVGGAGVVAGLAAQPHDGVAVDADQAVGLADAAAVLEVGEDGGRLVVRQAAVEQRRALPLREPLLAHLAVQEQPIAVPVAGADGDVALAPRPTARAVGVQAAEARQVGHDGTPGAAVDSCRQGSSLSDVVNQDRPPPNPDAIPLMPAALSPASSDAEEYIILKREI